MTDAERHEVNERIATAMGWKFRAREGTVDFWYQPNGVFYTALPDFVTDAVAADSLMRWLESKRSLGWSVQIAVDSYGWSVCVSHAIGHYVRHSKDNWMEALALAADKAIQEAGRGN